MAKRTRTEGDENAGGTLPLVEQLLERSDTVPFGGSRAATQEHASK